VNLEAWAARLLAIEAPRETIGLHVNDTIAAFLTGSITAEATALRTLYSEGTLVERAAAAAAIMRLSECDDIHLGSCVTPGAAIIPVALALSGDPNGATFHRAVSAAYSAAISLGQAIGGTKALHNGVWPTLLASPLMSAVTASCIFAHDETTLAHAMALALSGASGRIGRPAGMPSGRWFAFAESVRKGIRAAEAAGRGFRGDLDLISPTWLAAQAGHGSVDMGAFASQLPLIAETGFKPFPIARQGLNAVLAFQNLLTRGLDPQRIDSIEVFVPGMNVALLSRPASEQDRLSRISNMGYQLACAALAPGTLNDPERTPPAGVPLTDFAKRVTVTECHNLDAHLPNRWAARILVTAGDERLEETVVQSPFDGDALSVAAALTEKWRRACTAEPAEGFFPHGPQDDPISYAILRQLLEQRLTG